MKRLVSSLAVLAVLASIPAANVFAADNNVTLARHDGHQGFRPGPGRSMPGRPMPGRPVEPGRQGHDWDRGAHFPGHYWGFGWELRVFHGPWFVIEPVYENDPYGAVWMYVWDGYQYDMVQALWDAQWGRYRYIGNDNQWHWVQ